MSVVVRMEMPSDCERCPMCGTASGGNGLYELWCMCGDIPASSQKRPEDCPIICSLPEGHGPLVDADANFLGVIHLNGGGFANYNTTIAERLGKEDMWAVKTIVPATEGGNHEAD